jgi:hypothetical protein
MGSAVETGVIELRVICMSREITVTLISNGDELGPCW